MHNNIYLGKFDGEEIYLMAPSRDCGRYRGCGYIGNKHLHMHMDGRMLKNLVALNVYEDQDIEFADWLKEESTRWNLIELFKSITHWKKHAEFLKNAGHIGVRGKELLNIHSTKESRQKEMKHINETVLPKLFNLVQELYESVK